MFSTNEGPRKHMTPYRHSAKTVGGKRRMWSLGIAAALLSVLAPAAAAQDSAGHSSTPPRGRT